MKAVILSMLFPCLAFCTADARERVPSLKLKLSEFSEYELLVSKDGTIMIKLRDHVYEIPHIVHSGSCECANRWNTHEELSNN